MDNKKQIAIIGGGIAGLETAVSLAQLGYSPVILEKEKQTGGHLNHWFRLFPDFSDPSEITGQLQQKISNSGINIFYQTEAESITETKNGLMVHTANNMTLGADAIVIASGFNLFNAERKEEYGYGLFENVFTSKDIEAQLKKGQIETRQGNTPKRLAIIHCVGSRDAKCGNTYCSKVCCITAVKQAIEINRMAPDCEIFCFYMDLRLYGSKFDDLYLTAQKEHKIQFIRGRLSETSEHADKSLQLKAEDTLSGRPLKMNVDMIVLMAGIEPSTLTSQLSDAHFTETDENGFIKSKQIHTSRNYSTHSGVFLAGTSICPMSVNETLENARSAALSVHQYLTGQQ